MCWGVCWLMVPFAMIIIMFIEEEANMIKQMSGQMYKNIIHLILNLIHLL